MDRIVIIGLGLIGGSLGMALKAAGIRNTELVGVDLERDAVGAAKKKGAVDVTVRLASEAVKGAQLIIVATPILAMPEVFKEIAPHLPEGCIVTDTGSTKQQVLRWAEELLPSNVSFIGGHPMAGKEVPGIGGASASLFQRATYCITPSASASRVAVEVVVGLATTVGATPYFVAADEHDMLVAGISHLPLLMSSALVTMITQNPSWDELSKLASSGFHDVSRLASSDINLSRGITLTNQAGMLHWLDSYLEVLRDYRRALAENTEALLEKLSSARDARDQWLLHLSEPQRDRLFQDLPTAGEQMMEMFMGGRLAQLLRQQEDTLKEIESKHPRR
ncbi:MAG TPA: prephenate dehydrogenase/arogenate dehydrogenase family protein [Dehalococcoidia bacterium]|nr:prephenate dehydrogenase/arogenate dehydrogenase family protein [Dehalococcoidia bacterium]